ncbi:TPA: hypothetical protein ACX6RU_003737 [Photobacterium damselae]
MNTKQKKWNFFIVGSCSLLMAQPSQALIEVALSPGDSYIASSPMTISASNTKGTYGAGFCVGFGIQGSALYDCVLKSQLTLTPGVTAKINKLSMNVRGTRKGSSVLYTGNAEFNNGVVTRCEFPTRPPGEGGVCNASSDMRIYMGGGGVQYYFTYSGSASLYNIELASTAQATPGKYSVWISLAAVSTTVWASQSRQQLDVYIRDNTCTLLDQVVNIGNIAPGSIATKPLSLNLSCTQPPMGAQWKYSNINYNGIDNNTNLDNVTLRVKNSLGEVKNEDTEYLNIDELNNLTIEVDAKNAAQAGQLKVPLQFTLTYS